MTRLPKDVLLADDFIEEMKTPDWICRVTGAPTGTVTMVGPGLGPLVIEVKPKHRHIAERHNPCGCVLATASLDNPRRADGILPFFGENHCLFPVIDNGRVVFQKRDIRARELAIIRALDDNNDAAAPPTVTILPFVRSRTPSGVKAGLGQGKPQAKGYRGAPYSSPRHEFARNMAKGD